MNIASYWSGGSGPLSFSVSQGSLPPGLTLSPAGDISGTPTAIGTFPVVFRATDSTGHWTPSNTVTFEVDGVGYSVYDSFSSSGPLTTREGEIGAAWEVLTTYGNIYGSASPPALPVASGHLRMSGNVAWGQALSVFRPSGQPASGDPDTYVEFEADLPNDIRSDAQSQFSINVFNAAGSSTTMRIVLDRSQTWSVDKWALLVDAGGLLFGDVDELDNVPAATPVDFVEGVPIKVRVEYRDGGADLRLYVDDSLLAYLPGLAFEFAEVQASFYYQREDPAIDSDVTEDGVRVNYLKVGDLTGIPGPLTFAIPLPDAIGTEGVPLTLSLASHWFGGTAPVTYSVVSGTLPAGLTLDGDAGEVSGTPTTAGSATGLVLRAADANAVTADSDAFDITVSSGSAPRWLSRTTTEIYYSDDRGTTWTATGFILSNAVYLCWGNGLFVMGQYSSGTDNIYTSPDGITWTQRTVGVSGQCTGAVWNGSVFVVAKWNTTNRVVTSPDGITWTARSVPVNTASVAPSLHWADDIFVLSVSASTDKVATSPDGITWTLRAVPALASGGGHAKAALKIGSTYSMLPESATARFLTTADFSSFTQQTNGSTQFPIATLTPSIATDGTTWVCVGSGGVFSTTDGLTFTNRWSGATVNAVHWDGAEFLAKTGTTVLRSTDGTTWSSSTASVSGLGLAVAYSDL